DDRVPGPVADLLADRAGGVHGDQVGGRGHGPGGPQAVTGCSGVRPRPDAVRDGGQMPAVVVRRRWNAQVRGLAGTLIPRVLGSTRCPCQEEVMQAMTKVSSRAALLSLGLLAATCVLTPARAQLIDAGGQA